MRVPARRVDGLLWILPFAILVASTLAMALLVDAQRARSSGSATISSGAALPDGIVPIHRPPALVGVASLDGGVKSLIALDRHDGFTAGLMQDYRHGARHLRLTAKVYRTARGAHAAYARAALFLRRILPDPVLHARIGPMQGIGTAATLAIYASAFGRLRYTATALVAVDGRAVCEAQAFPDGISDGDPSHDPGDLSALVQRCLAGVPAL